MPTGNTNSIKKPTKQKRQSEAYRVWLKWLCKKNFESYLSNYTKAYWTCGIILMMSIIFLFPAVAAINRGIPLDGVFLMRDHKSRELVMYPVKPTLIGFGTSAFLSSAFLLAVLITAPHNRKNRYPYE